MNTRQSCLSKLFRLFNPTALLWNWIRSHVIDGLEYYLWNAVPEFHLKYHDIMNHTTLLAQSAQILGKTTNLYLMYSAKKAPIRNRAYTFTFSIINLSSHAVSKWFSRKLLSSSRFTRYSTVVRKSPRIDSSFRASTMCLDEKLVSALLKTDTHSDGLY